MVLFPNFENSGPSGFRQKNKEEHFLITHIVAFIQPTKIIFTILSGSFLCGFMELSQATMGENAF